MYVRQQIMYVRSLFAHICQIMYVRYVCSASWYYHREHSIVNTIIVSALYIHVYVCICIHIYIYIYIQLCVYVCIYIYIYINESIDRTID